LCLPGLSLLGQGARLVLGFPGRQGGLLGQFQGLDWRRRTPVGGLEVGGQFAVANLDGGPPGGPPLVQGGVDVDDLAHRTFARIWVRTLGETQPQPVVKASLQRGVVRLGRRHIGLEEHAPVDAQPAPVPGLDLVRDRDMGMQIGVTSPGVPMGESRRHHPLDVDLADPIGALPGEQGVGFDERQGIFHGALMGRLDPGSHLRVGHRPQRRDRLHRRERQIEPRDRRSLGSGVPGDQPGQLTRILRLPAVLGDEELAGHLGANLGTLSGRHRPVTR